MVLRDGVLLRSKVLHGVMVATVYVLLESVVAWSLPKASWKLAEDTAREIVEVYTKG